MTIAVVSGQAVFSFTDAAAQSSLASGNFPSNVTAGNLICGYVKFGTATTVFNNITDTRGNTYVMVDSITGSAGGANTMKTFYARNISGGANSVTCNFTGATGVFPRIMVVELSGCDTTASVVNAHEANSQTTPGTGVGAITSAGTASTTVANCGLIAFAQDYNNTAGTSSLVETGTFSGVATGATPPNNFDVSRAAFKVLAAAGAAHGTFTDATNGALDTYSTMLLAFQPPQAAGAAHVRGPMVITKQSLLRSNL